MDNRRINDKLFSRVKAYAIEKGQIRIGRIQRDFSIGYLKAKYIFDRLVAEGLGKVNKEGILIVR